MLSTGSYSFLGVDSFLKVSWIADRELGKDYKTTNLLILQIFRCVVFANCRPALTPFLSFAVRGCYPLGCEQRTENTRQEKQHEHCFPGKNLQERSTSELWHEAPSANMWHLPVLKSHWTWTVWKQHHFHSVKKLDKVISCCQLQNQKCI